MEVYSTPFWGPYLSNRQWGTVREDVSLDGNSWESVSYEEACSTVYSWGEDGLFGYSDRNCHLCMSLALWNGEDPIMKERLFGLTGPQGNHGEDMKELLYYIDGTHDHSYMKALYKYPYGFPYSQLTDLKRRRGTGDPEFEIMDTGIFDRDEYFDIQVEYAGTTKEDGYGSMQKSLLVCCYTITNHGATERELTVIPQFWFRKSSQDKTDPSSGVGFYFDKRDFPTIKTDVPLATHISNSKTQGFSISCCSSDVEILMTHNRETDRKNRTKDAFHRCIVDGDQKAAECFQYGKVLAEEEIHQLNFEKYTKCGLHHRLSIPPKGMRKVYWTVVDTASRGVFDEFGLGNVVMKPDEAELEKAIQTARQTAVINRQHLFQKVITESWIEEIIRQAYAGLFWNKQYYHYNMVLWARTRDQLLLQKVIKQTNLPKSALDKLKEKRIDTYSELTDLMKHSDRLDQCVGRVTANNLRSALRTRLLKEKSKNQGLTLGGNWQKESRNTGWEHMDCHDIISMPDKWEFPWFASWDLVFQMIPFSRVDPGFAEQQILLLLSDRFMHPNGQLPGCEWDFSDVFPPIQAWGCLQIHDIRKQAGVDNIKDFLRPCFDALQRNFNWWMENLKINGSHLFSGGFLGMDNISVVDRSYVLQNGFPLQQADATGWMALFSLCMVRMATILSIQKPTYAKYTAIYVQHFINIAEDLNRSVQHGGLWDPHDKFYYDVCITPTRRVPLRVRSLVGIIPMFASLYISDTDLIQCRRLSLVLKQKSQTSSFIERREDGYFLSAVPRDRAGHLVRVLVDEEEFLSRYGFRSLSKVYEQDPYILHLDEDLRKSLCVSEGDKELCLQFTPGESNTRMFGGNSNWRGPVWLCMNYMLVQALNDRGDKQTLYPPLSPTAVSKYRNISKDIAHRIVSLFKIDKDTGLRPCNGPYNKYKQAGWSELILFYEYFHGDTGRGCGASHQTGWTALVIEFLMLL